MKQVDKIFTYRICIDLCVSGVARTLPHSWLWLVLSAEAAIKGKADQQKEGAQVQRRNYRCCRNCFSNSKFVDHHSHITIYTVEISVFTTSFGIHPPSLTTLVKKPETFCSPQ